MGDPFLIEGPAYVAFSGGRTSGYLLRRVLDAGLRPDVYVLFANTGLELPETYDFVREVGERWGVPVRWLKFEAGGFREVDAGTCAREGEPFKRLIQAKQGLPNRQMRWCSQYLKVETMRAFMRRAGYDAWASVMGIRADEPRRVAKIRGRRQEECEDIALPLADAGVMTPNVRAFWDAQPFDLQLEPGEGNCYLCFLKGARLRLHLMQRRPELVPWYLAQQEQTGWQWINPQGGRPSYGQLAESARAQVLLPMLDVEEEQAEVDCTCTD